MNQQVFWHETFWDALDADIKACEGYKTVGAKLRPELSPDDAGKWLRNCVDPNQRQNIDGTQILLIKQMARAKGATNTVDFEAQKLNFRAEWISPEDELTRLMRRQNELSEQLLNTQKLSNELMAQSRALQAVK